jgi:hypothetical protein
MTTKRYTYEERAQQGVKEAPSLRLKEVERAYPF